MRIPLHLALLGSGFLLLHCPSCVGSDGFYVSGGNGFAFVNSNGVLTARFDSGGSGAAAGLAWDGKGSLYGSFGTALGVMGLPPVGIIKRFTLDGQGSVVAGGFYTPTALAFDSQGNLYVADWLQGTISKVAPDHSTTLLATLIGTAPPRPVALAFDKQDNLYVAVSEDPFLTVISPSGAMSRFGTSLTNILQQTSIQGRLVYENPSGLAFDQNTNAFISFSGGSIKRLTPEGVASTFVSRLSGPGALAFDNSGNLYVALVGDGSGEIDRITPAGEISLFTREAGPPASIVAGPAPLFTTPKPSSDRPGCTVVTLAGFGQAGDSVGMGAIAEFNEPSGGFVDSQGNLRECCEPESRC